jgi:hypothetical protein
LTFGAQTCNGDSYQRLENIIAKIEIPAVRIYLRMALLPAQFWEVLEPTGKERQNLHQKGTALVHESFDVAQSPVYRKDDELREDTENVQGATMQESGDDSSYQKQLAVCVAADSRTATDETQRHFCYYKDMMEHAQSQDWDTCEVEDEPLLECVTRVVLAAVLKHTGFLPRYNSKYVYVLHFLELFKKMYGFT